MSVSTPMSSISLVPIRIELEGRPALPAPVVARLHRQPEIAEAGPPTRSPSGRAHTDPADPALAERDPDVRVALEDGSTITAARMLTKFIWKPATLVKKAARRV